MCDPHLPCTRRLPTSACPTRFDICTPRPCFTFSSPRHSTITHLIDRQRNIYDQAIVDEKDRPCAFLSERGIYKRCRSTANMTSTYDLLLTMLHAVHTLPVVYRHIVTSLPGKYVYEVLLALRLPMSGSLGKAYLAARLRWRSLSCA